jgi:hypothetical protein
MTHNFESLSNEIANDFIQSVVFIDDKAYSATDDADIQHNFDVQAITRSFAHNKKICSVFQPESAEDISMFSEIAEKADIAILDWQIIIQQQSAADSNEDDEDDAEDDDIRGVYTKTIIRNLLSSVSNQNSLKLIIIYTGETDLSNIAADVLADLSRNQVNGFSIPDDDECSIVSKSCTILVRAKSNGGAGRGTHNPTLLNKEVTYEELPEFINSEFSKLTSGLLSNFTLQALTAVRKNFFQILNVFSKELDAAYLTHKSLLSNVNDANELLVDLLGDTFISILRAENLNNSISESVVSKWIDTYISDEQRPTLDSSGNPTANLFNRNKEILKAVLVSSKDVKQKFIDKLYVNGISNTSAKKNYRKYAFGLFHPQGDGEASNISFSQLCQRKDLIKYEQYSPMLTLGTVVKSSLEQGAYYVCIQQRCDSVRVGEQEKRRFLFLSLSIADGNKSFDFITPTGQKLKLDSSTFNVRTIKFHGSQGGTVHATNGESMYFEPAYFADEAPEKFEYIFELKDLYAQRVVEQYSSLLSRVGLDEPEWVRLSRDN